MSVGRNQREENTVPGIRLEWGRAAWHGRTTALRDS